MDERHGDERDRGPMTADAPVRLGPAGRRLGIRDCKGIARAGREALQIGCTLVLASSLVVVLLTDAAVAQGDSENRRSAYPVPLPSSATRIAPPPPQIDLRLEPALPEITFAANVRVNSDPGTLGRPQVEPS